MQPLSTGVADVNIEKKINLFVLLDSIIYVFGPLVFF
jgi:hypothetical protein